MAAILVKQFPQLILHYGFSVLAAIPDVTRERSVPAKPGKIKVICDHDIESQDHGISNAAG